MREILFRGKRKDNGAWVEGTGVVYTGKETLIVKFNYYFDYYEVIPETIGQYTGLTDKNGKKIFEGDIVKITERGMEGAGVVVFRNIYAGGWVISDSADSKHTCSLCMRTCVEIIGNIHDNPELLKGGVE